MLMTRVGQWLNLVERCFRVAEAESSNLSCPTNLKTPGMFRRPRGLPFGAIKGYPTSIASGPVTDPEVGDQVGEADSDNT